MNNKKIGFSLKIFFVITLLISPAGYLFSQRNISQQLTLSHTLNYHPSGKPFNYNKNFLFSFAVPETLNVYAAMVQFQQDSDPNTTGDGRFDVSSNYPDSVDAPPHDSLYFANHLEFLKNYYYKASKGKLIINFRIIGGVRTLSGTMPQYSPGKNEGLNKLGTLFYETWASVDSVVDFSGINPDNSAFIIFHAGTGRDVDLVSQGIFQGALDIPSLFLGSNSLKQIYGDTTRGYYTHEGLIIQSSCILPEQEWRIINTSFGDVFLELGLNGITVATIGSHLGLPDLFDTQTGRTAIGRFGLMDGQSIFSYLGVFPPEPSAWEKQYLGWINPIVIGSDGNYITRAASLDADGNSSVYKVLISAKEYFLIENRNRDAHKDGETVYFIKNGVRDSIKFTKDVDGFASDGIGLLKGNIVNVDELDWSLPGLKNDTADYQGGILVWHIDENVIDAKIGSNTINTDIHHRGVNVEEAKGSQDIGVVISTPLGDFVSDGFFVDFWYNGNHYRPSNIYQNTFNQNTFPNSNSYSGIRSRVCLSNFSTIDSSMTFTFQQCSSISNISSYPHKVGRDLSGNAQPIGIDFNGDGKDEVFVNVNDTLYGFRDNGNPIRVDRSNGFLKDSVADFIVGYLEYNIGTSGKRGSQNKYITGVHGNKLSLLGFNIDSTTTDPNIINIYHNGGVLTTPALNELSLLALSKGIYAGSSDGKICLFRLDSLFESVNTFSNNPVIELASSSSGSDPLGISAIDNTNKFFVESFLPVINPPTDPPSLPVYVNLSNKIVLGGGYNNKIISGNLGVSNVYCSPVIANLYKDGKQEILFTADDKVFAVNQNGVLVTNFPFSVAGVSRISSGISVADLDGDGIMDVIFGTADGRVYAYNINGKILDGFPLLTGSEVKSTPAIINTAGKFGIVVYSTDGYLYGWKTPWDYDSTRIQWRNYLKDKYHTNYNSDKTGSSATGPCLPQDKVYNWPNPAYGTSTNIRYFLGNDAGSVSIKIMDLSGELVTTLAGTNFKGLDNEVQWDLSKVQSGIYIAVVQLQGGSCNESASIKIAVVK
jgi:hypothetical protein